MANKPASVIFVDLLVQIAQGIGDGHRRLVGASESPIGTLVVKDAEVDIEFEMQAEQSRTGGGLLVVPTPIFAFGAAVAADKNFQSNRGKVKLHIVNVPGEQPPPAALDKPTKPAEIPAVADFGRLLELLERLMKSLDAASRNRGKPATGGDDGNKGGSQPGTGRGLPSHGPGTVATAGVEAVRRLAANLKELLAAYVPSDRAARATKTKMARRIAAIERQFDSGDANAAVIAFRNLVGDNLTFLQSELKLEG